MNLFILSTKTQQKVNSLIRSSRFLPFLVPLLILPLIIYWNDRHNIILENDGIIQIWIGKYFLETSKYIGYGSDHWPFLTPFLLGLVSHFSDPFIGGKILSAFSVFFAILAVYYVSLSILKDRKFALVSQLFAATNGLLIAMSYYVDNHALDTFFVITSFAFLFRIFDQADLNIRNFFFLGLFSGLALITRTNSVILIITEVIALILMKRFNSKTFLAYFLPIIVFQIFSISITYHSKGTFFPSSAYVFTLAHEIDPALKNHPLGWFLATEKYTSLKQIILQNPTEMLSHIIQSLKITINHIFIISGTSKYLLLLGLIIFPFQRYRIYWLTIVLFYAGNLLLISIFFFNIEFLLHFAILNSLFISLSLLVLYKLMIKKLRIFLICLIPIIVFLNFKSTSDMTNYFASRNIEELPSLPEVINFLKQNDKEIDKKFLMSRHQGYSYYTNAKFLPFFPNYFQCNISKASSFTGIDSKFYKYFSIHPPILLENLQKSPKADYFIYTTENETDPCGFHSPSFGGSKETEGYSVVYRNLNVTIFKKI